MKYNVGDKVKIRSLDWYNANKNENDIIKYPISFTCEMSRYCGKIAIITRVNHSEYDINYSHYNINLDNGYYLWADEMFEENFKDMETKEIIIPQGWEVNKVEGNKIILKESKKELPKTWFECLCRYKGDLEYIHNSTSNIAPHVADGFFPSDKNLLPKGLGKPMLALMQLLICREAYRQGWKPDWEDDSTKYYIEYFDGEIDIDQNLHFSRVLSFQSKEIMDKFLENFRDLIDEAKELI